MGWLMVVLEQPGAVSSPAHQTSQPPLPCEEQKKKIHPVRSSKSGPSLRYLCQELSPGVPRRRQLRPSQKSLGGGPWVSLRCVLSRVNTVARHPSDRDPPLPAK